MTRRYVYAGPDGESIGSLPPGTGAAIGSDYCAHLLPSPERLAGLLAAQGTGGPPLLLLSPYLRHGDLRRLVALLRAVPPGAPLDVAVNDWGGLLALATLKLPVRLSVGRLLSGQKRCPRIGVSGALSDAGRAWHGDGTFNAPRAAAWLRERFGVAGFHVDAPPWGAGSLGALLASPPEALRGLSLFVHAPWSVVTVSDACPFIGGASSASVASCPRPCRAGTVVLREPSMGGDLALRGKARFAIAPLPTLPAGAEVDLRTVTYPDPP